MPDILDKYIKAAFIKSKYSHLFSEGANWSCKLHKDLPKRIWWWLLIAILKRSLPFPSSRWYQIVKWIFVAIFLINQYFSLVYTSFHSYPRLMYSGKDYFILVTPVWPWLPLVPHTVSKIVCPVSGREAFLVSGSTTSLESYLCLYLWFYVLCMRGRPEWTDCSDVVLIYSFCCIGDVFSVK